MRIRQKLRAGFFVFALLVVLVASQVIPLSGHVEQLRHVELPMEQNLREVEVSIWEATHAADAFRSTADPYYSELYEEQFGKVNAFFSKYITLIDTAAERRSTEEFGRYWWRANVAGEQMMELVTRQKAAEDELFTLVDEADDIIDFKIQAVFSSSDPNILAKEQALREVEVSIWEVIHAAEQYTGLDKNIERSGHAQKTFAQLMEKQFDDVAEFWAKYKTLADAESETEPIREFETKWTRAITVARGLVTTHDKTEQQFSEMYKQISLADGVIDYKMQKYIEKRIADRGQAAGRAKIVTIAVSIFAIIAALIIGTIITRSICRPLKTLADATAELSRGNMDYRIGSKRRDEIGDLARAFDRMSEEVQTSSQRLRDELRDRRQAENELQQKIEQLERSSTMTV
ncbi:MAG: HAMP domain-containing protein [Phycisphaerae bacterium]|jgi:HAMP domain-containing protein|nr:HAMP domain-containing protein [Phycisphaerae bacterium]